MVGLLDKLGRFVVARPWYVLVVALAMTIGAGLLLPKLDILTSRTALYPPHLEVNKRFHSFLEDFGTTSSLIAVLEGEQSTLGPFADRFAAQLALEGEVVEDVFYKADVDFFAEHAYLYLPVEQLEEAGTWVKAHADEFEEVGRIDGLAPLMEKLAELETGGPQEQIDMAQARELVLTAKRFVGEFEAWLDDPGRTEIGLFEELLEKETAGRGMDREGYLRSRDGKMLFLFIQPTSNSDEFDFLKKFVGNSRAAYGRAAMEWEAQGLAVPTVGFTGLPAQGVEENTSIRRDVIMTASVAAVLILLIILVGFGSIVRGILVFIPLLLAGLWNLGLTALTVGHLTILTSAFTAILFGLGVDYGIFISGRIVEERQRGLSNADAIVKALTTSGRTLVAAGGTTALAFFVIGTVEFTGFAELGIVAGSGVVLVMVATLLVLPALTALMPLALKKKKGRQDGPSPVGRLPRRFFTGAATVVALALAVLSLIVAFKIPLDFSLESIMPRNSEAMEYQRRMSDNSDFQAEFLAAPARDLEEARQMTERFRALPSVARVESISDVLPTGQARKAELTREIAPVVNRITIPKAGYQPFTGPELAGKFEELTDMVAEAQEKAFAGGQKELMLALGELVSRMEDVVEKLEDNPSVADGARAFEKALFKVLFAAFELTGKWEAAAPLSPGDLPANILNRFRGESGKYAIFVFPNRSIYDVAFLDGFLEKAYEIAPEATGFPATHQVFSRMTIAGFRQATLYALLVVFFMLFLEFRHVGYALSGLLPLALGGSWMFGLMYVAGRSFNYANIIALPLVIGLAVDYGVYITHRLREDQGLSPFDTMKRAGKPVVMAALTTMAGIGAICLGEHRGAASLGEAMIYGIITCLAAAIVALPCAAAALQGLFSARGSHGAGKGGKTHE